MWDAPSFGAYTFGERTYGGWDFAFGGFTFGDYAFGDYTFEDVSGSEWGEWDAASGENPADCLRSENADKITLISNVVTPGAITDGAVVVGNTEPGMSLGEYVVAGGITYGEITEGAVTNDGADKVFATFGGVTKGL